ncbi:hypothetical protein Hdeb2414_s0008g00267431 [Helianthus debilis subsp. tardiflorus]
MVVDVTDRFRRCYGGQFDVAGKSRRVRWWRRSQTLTFSFYRSQILFIFF